MRIALIALLVSTTPAWPQVNTLSNFVDSTGSTVQVSPEHPTPINGATNIPTYATGASLSNTGAGDIFCIQGSATKTVRIKAIRINAIANAATVVPVTAVRRSSVGTGGTPVNAPLTPSDSRNAAATATATAYTTSPTGPVAIGTVRARLLAIGTTGNSNTIGDELFNFGQYYDQPQVLRGTGEFLCVNVGGTGAGTGASILVGTELTESNP